EFEIIKASISSLTEDRRLQALVIAVAFNCFLEGTAGFGTPVAITAAMLAGLGFNPIFAAAVCLVANTAPVALGGVGIPTVVAASVTGLDFTTVAKYGVTQTGLLALIVPLWIAVMIGGWKRVGEVLPAVIVCGVVFAVTHVGIVNYVNAYITDLLSSIILIAVMAGFFKVWKPSRIYRFDYDAPVNENSSQKCAYSGGEIIRAWGPYIILAVLVFLWADAKLIGFKNVLVGMDKGFSFLWPGLHNEVIKTIPVVAADTPYGAKYALNIVSATGTAILCSGILGLFLMPNYGFGKGIACFFRTLNQLKWPIFTIACILGLAYIMNYSSMSYTLGLAFTATGSLFPFFSPLLGYLGVFLTGSDTSSCALFAAMQKTAAEQLSIDPNLLVAGNASGGVCAKMISPQSISVACAATNQIGQESAILRAVVGHSILMVLILAVLIYLQSNVLGFMLPG
ncbi:MAG: lactate permease LctP family transporter, partial [Selenomonadales bacterium]|nr:lactate permease LctP family transporter [Selenomonadales bacterium]